jgi:hypothetical protein
MTNSGSLGWRAALAASAVFVLAGAPQHPGGTMAEMLADPVWFSSHALISVGFVALIAALVSYGRSMDLPPATRRWLRIALIGTVLQTIEMFLHTMAYVDAANLVAGRATPVLTTHLVLTVVFYPVFAITMGGFLIAATRERSLGSPWFNWLGVAGVLCHGLAGVLVPIFNLEWARMLFPMLALFSIWSLLAAAWPTRARTTASVPLRHTG